MQDPHLELLNKNINERNAFNDYIIHLDDFAYLAQAYPEKKGMIVQRLFDHGIFLINYFENQDEFYPLLEALEDIDRNALINRVIEFIKDYLQRERKISFLGDDHDYIRDFGPQALSSKMLYRILQFCPDIQQNPIFMQFAREKVANIEERLPSLGFTWDRLTAYDLALFSHYVPESRAGLFEKVFAARDLADEILSSLDSVITLARTFPERKKELYKSIRSFRLIDAIIHNRDEFNLFAKYFPDQVADIKEYYFAFSQKIIKYFDDTEAFRNSIINIYDLDILVNEFPEKKDEIIERVLSDELFFKKLIASNFDNILALCKVFSERKSDILDRTLESRSGIEEFRHIFKLVAIFPDQEVLLMYLKKPDFLEQYPVSSYLISQLDKLGVHKQTILTTILNHPHLLDNFMADNQSYTIDTSETDLNPLTLMTRMITLLPVLHNKEIRRIFFSLDNLKEKFPEEVYDLKNKLFEFLIDHPIYFRHMNLFMNLSDYHQNFIEQIGVINSDPIEDVFKKAIKDNNVSLIKVIQRLCENKRIETNRDRVLRNLLTHLVADELTPEDAKEKLYVEMWGALTSLQKTLFSVCAPSLLMITTSFIERSETLNIQSEEIPKDLQERKTNDSFSSCFIDFQKPLEEKTKPDSYEDGSSPNYSK